MRSRWLAAAALAAVLVTGCSSDVRFAPAPSPSDAPSTAATRTPSPSATPSRTATPSPKPTATTSGIDPKAAMSWPVPDEDLTPGSLTPGCSYPRDADERNVTAATKRKVLATYDIADDPSDPYDIELDHLIPFSLCGSNGPTNIWPERYDGVKKSAFVRNQKDRLEAFAARQVRYHDADPHRGWTLAFAQQVFRGDWRVAWCKYVPTAGVTCP